jgi:flagella basal body P-ring formation protein FlgA
MGQVVRAAETQVCSAAAAPFVPRGPNRSGQRLRFRAAAAVWAGLALARGLPAAQDPLVLEVEADHVRAADLARALPEWRQAPAEAELLYAPLPGAARELLREDLERLAAREGVHPAAGWPERVRIIRKQRPLTALEAEAALAASFAGRHRVSPEDVEIALPGFRSPLVPCGPLVLRSGGLVDQMGRLLAVPLAWSTPGRQGGTVWLQARFRVRGSYAVAAREIEPHRKIEAADVSFREGDIEAPVERWILEPPEVLGKALRRRLAPGEKVARPWLVSLKTIERGDLVELRLSRGPIELRAAGRAEQSGSIGDRLSFRNLDSGRLVRARVLEAGRAEIEAAAAGAVYAGTPDWRNRGRQP